MAYRFFQVPVRDGGAAGEELNRFLRGHRVLSVDRRWVDLGTESYWSFCVDYIESAPGSGSSTRAQGEPRGKVDYREVLTPEQFATFVKLRTLRQAISKEEGVPVYVIFTNEQLAAMVRKRSASKADMGRIDGIGEARIQKYGNRFLAGTRRRTGTTTWGSAWPQPCPCGGFRAGLDRPSAGPVRDAFGRANDESSCPVLVAIAKARGGPVSRTRSARRMTRTTHHRPRQGPTAARGGT
jgi:HRDC domain